MSHCWNRWVCLATGLLPLSGVATDLSIPHAGRILDGDDLPVSRASVPMRFRLREAALPSAAESVLWEANCTVAVRQGAYAVSLGSECGAPMTEAVWPDGSERFLEVAVDNVTLQPRLRLGRVPRAALADNALRLGGRPAADYALRSELAQTIDTRVLPLQTGLAQTQTSLTQTQTGLTQTQTSLGQTQATLTQTQAGLSALADAGTVNQATNPVHYTKLKGVPSFLEGVSVGTGLTGDGTAASPLVFSASSITIPWSTVSGVPSFLSTVTVGSGLLGTGTAANPLRVDPSISALGTGITSSGGRLGIGTSSPQAPLDVVGDVIIRGNLYLQGQTIQPAWANLTADAQTFAANSWTPIVWNGVTTSSGIGFASSTLNFSSGGVYRITVSHRTGAGGDVWTAYRLWGGGQTVGISAGTGQFGTHSPDMMTVSFLANIPQGGGAYQIQVGRQSSDLTPVGTTPIAGVAHPVIQATVTKASDPAASGSPFVQPAAQLEGPAQTFANNVWTAVTFNNMPVSTGISYSAGKSITVPKAGIYRVSLSYRHGAGADVWTAVRLFGDGASRGMSAGYGNFANSPELATLEFLARIDNASVPYEIQVGRAGDSGSVAVTGAIAGESLPAVQATLQRVGDLSPAAGAKAFAQFEGAGQTFAANTWTGATFNSAPIASGITVSGKTVTFANAGIYRITWTARPGFAGDVWTAVRLFDGSQTRGISAGTGNVGGNSVEPETFSFLATVPSAGNYEIQLGRLSSDMQVATPATVVGQSAPGVQVTIEQL